MKKLLILLFFITSFQGFAQKMSITGSVQDTVAKTAVKNAVVMAVRLKDSLLIAHTRTDVNGNFALHIPIDTVQVIITEPRFGDQSFYVVGSAINNVFDFGKTVLPPKSQQLKEVVIYAYKDPVYYKGDTLVYTADSFKVKPNATVEDLLRKLPGIKVDAAGKITSQGKEVSQVLVDGDEFFGSDPTVATKNLTAKGVESVQVYEKKNDDAADGGDETIQVMDLKMKEDAKKGYFGKASGASDFQNFYEGELLANKFKGSQKISFFALGSNTPRSSLGWGDMYKYGLDNETGMQEDEDGNRFWTRTSGDNTGIPQTLKSGFYYSDKLSKKTKLNLNYTYNNNQLKAKSETRSQYFLVDTSYITENESEQNQKLETHVVNLKLVQTLDSLTELELKPNVQINGNSTRSFNLNLFKTASDTLTRVNDVENKNDAKGYDFTIPAKLTRKFKKKDRLLVLNYSFNKKNDEADGLLKSNNTYYSGVFFPNDSINQKKENVSNKEVHNARINYTEPLTKKIKIGFDYMFNSNVNSQNKKAFNYFNGEYSVNDSIFSNNFQNQILYNRAGLRFIYETKKITFVMGLRGQDNQLTNTNKILNTKITYGTNALLPHMNFSYKFNDNSRYNFTYNTKVNQPSIAQLQPVQDNTNPNRIVIGNPGLKPAYNHNITMNYNSHKPVSGRYIWTYANIGFTNNAFANNSSVDSIGRTASQTINVDGNYNGNFYLGGSMPLFSKLIELRPGVNGYFYKNTNYINFQKNNTHTSTLNFELDVTLQTDSLDFTIGGNYNLNQTKSSLNQLSNKPYSGQSFYADFTWLLPFKFVLKMDANYTINSQRSQGYNINFLIWNAKLSKAFLKNENLILTAEANDILNQNINTERNTYDNVITDSKTNIISRYFLLRLTYKFNSTKTKDNDDDW